MPAGEAAFTLVVSHALSAAPEGSAMVETGAWALVFPPQAPTRAVLRMARRGTALREWLRIIVELLFGRSYGVVAGRLPRAPVRARGRRSRGGGTGGGPGGGG